MTMTLPRFDDIQPQEPSGGFGSLDSDFGNLPLQRLGYDAHVVGLSMRTTIRQTFYNPFNEVIEAIYIFPIEGEQSVVDCEMRVAERTIRACLKERGEARRDYTRALRSGHRAALLEENRPETFSMKVGNIPPGEAIQVRIETVGVLPVVDGEWTLRLPLVVAPRYTSGLPLPQSPVGSGTAPDTDQVPDASTVTPPTWLPGFANPVQLRLDVDLEMNQLADSAFFSHLRSSLHAVLVERDDSQPSSRCRVSVQPGERVDRDFILRGRLDASHVKTSLALEPSPVSPSKMTFALTIVPPKAIGHAPRDVVFLLDRSGSMSGWKISAARRGISRLVDSLNSQDRFHAMAFDDHIDRFLAPSKNGAASQGDWLAATNTNRYEAVRWLGGIEARGGTEMGAAIQHGLSAFDTDGNGRALRQRAMVLVTDGQVTGEDTLLRILGSIPEMARPRLFCLGIDRAVNASVLQRLAKLTGGTFELVESEKRLDEVLQRLGSEIGAPAISHLRVASDTDEEISLAPSNASTLFARRSLSIYGQTALRDGITLNLEGDLSSGEVWRETVTAANDRARSQVPLLLPLWGRAHVRELEDELASRGDRDPQLAQRIVECSLACNVLSRLTAFVAVDEAERVSNGESLHAIVQPSAYPEGWAMPLAPLDRSALIRAPRPSVPPFSLHRYSEQTVSALPEQLLKRRLVSTKQLAEAETIARQTDQSLGNVLLKLEFVSGEDVARAVAEVTRAPFIDLSNAQIPASVIGIVPESVARENLVLPVSETDEALTIAVCDPNDLDMLSKIEFILNKRVAVQVASAHAIQEALNRFYVYEEGEVAYSIADEYESADSLCEFTDTQIDFSSVSSYLCAPVERSEPEFQPTDTPVVKLVNLMLTEATQLRASHIMLTSKPDRFAVGYVIEGRLHERDSPPKRLEKAIVTRLMILSKLDITHRTGLQSVTLPVTIGTEEFEIQIHFSHKPKETSILICLPNANGDAVPEPVQKWWAENGE